MPPYKQAGSVEIPATCVTQPPYGGGGAPKGPSGVGFSSGALLFFEQLGQAGPVLIAEGSQGRGQHFEQLLRFAGGNPCPLLLGCREGVIRKKAELDVQFYRQRRNVYRAPI